jgi:hypothetical protein
MSTSFFEEVDSLRIQANKVLEGRRRSELGQYLTPAPISRLMASMFDDTGPRDLRILDPGAGVGLLLAAYVEHLLQKRKPPKALVSPPMRLTTILQPISPSHSGSAAGSASKLAPTSR